MARLPPMRESLRKACRFNFRTNEQPKESWASSSGRRMDSPALANSKRVAANGDSLVSGKTIAPTFEHHDVTTATGLSLNFHKLSPATSARREGRDREGGRAAPKLGIFLHPSYPLGGIKSQ